MPLGRVTVAVAVELAAVPLNGVLFTVVAEPVSGPG